MNGSRQQLALEAAVVGVGLIPMWMLVRRATTAMNIYGGKEIIDIALAGAAFHLLAEESGLNTWYLTNGYAAQKAFHDDITGNVLPADLDGRWYSRRVLPSPPDRPILPGPMLPPLPDRRGGWLSNLLDGPKGFP
jgi:hypothetical protein